MKITILIYTDPHLGLWKALQLIWYLEMNLVPTLQVKILNVFQFHEIFLWNSSFFSGDHSNSSSQPSSACIPKSPARTIIKAYLGEHGHTNVTVKPGLTIRDALNKAMKLRKLSPESCAVYNCADPSKVWNLPHFTKISWNQSFGIFFRHPFHGTWTSQKWKETK